ncbi:hypothetical protein SAMN05421823_1314, partial [Catalinimonas alkaloidigena]
PGLLYICGSGKSLPMKQLFTISLLFFYIVAMLRPVAPYIDYYARQDYIKAFLCINRDQPALGCNGHCYLQKQIEKQQQQDQQHAPRVKFEDYPIGWVSLISLQFAAAPSELTHCAFYRFALIPATPASVFHPPKG